MPTMRTPYLPAAVLVTASLFGCKENSPRQAFKDMQEAACNADTAGVLRLVDRTKMRENMSKRMQAQGANNILADAAATAIADNAMQAWEDNAKRGKDSDFCLATDLTWNEGSDRVRWVTPTGKQKLATYEPAGDTWIMVMIEDDKP